MADHCQICDTRRPVGGTNHLVLNQGKTWIEFCKPCGDSNTLTNTDTGETVTVTELFSRAEVGRGGCA